MRKKIKVSFLKDMIEREIDLLFMAIKVGAPEVADAILVLLDNLQVLKNDCLENDTELDIFEQKDPDFSSNDKALDALKTEQLKLTRNIIDVLSPIEIQL